MAEEKTKNKIQVSGEEGGPVEVTINGVKVAEISPAGNVLAFTDNVELAKPGAVAEEAVKAEGGSVNINEGRNTVSAYGAAARVAADGRLTVFTHGILTIKPVLEIGDKAEDGWICAGNSPDTGKPMFVAPADADMMSWWKSRKAARALQEQGKVEARLPSKNELKQIFSNRAKIGKFSLSQGFLSTAWYWSSTPNFTRLRAKVLSFSDGSHKSEVKGMQAFTRFVRS